MIEDMIWWIIYAIERIMFLKKKKFKVKNRWNLGKWKL